MKLLPILAINLTAMGIVLFAYDQMRADPLQAPIAPRQTATSETSHPAIDALDERLRAVESDRRRPRKAAEASAGILERLAALEAAANAGGADVEERSTEPVAMGTDEPVPMAAPGKPTAAEIKSFRMLREAVRQQDAAAKNAARIDGALDALALNLTEKQRKQVHSAYAAFEPQVRRIWGEAKAEAQRNDAGGETDWDEVIANTTAFIQTEFAATLEGVVPATDGERIAGALLSRGK